MLADASVVESLSETVISGSAGVEESPSVYLVYFANVESRSPDSSSLAMA